MPFVLLVVVAAGAAHLHDQVQSLVVLRMRGPLVAEHCIARLRVNPVHRRGPQPLLAFGQRIQKVLIPLRVAKRFAIAVRCRQLLGIPNGGQ